MNKKADLIRQITDLLAHTGREVVVKDISKLRNGRWGYHAYCLAYQYGAVHALPWSGANVSWTPDLMKLTRDELITIWERLYW